ncbi:MAG: hypothetical protein AUI14_07570 [Actinobacteria bacterium 13_2_20CM_2_71_6]|nr:MAG: hypothetical protein AUI14_07570 [Actinobacteria bacterium 13_2_20CM_2_71_6]
MSWLWSWLDLPAGWGAPPPAPVQGSAGTAAGKAHTVPASATRSGKGAGHVPGKGAGQLDAYAPHRLPTPGPVVTSRRPDPGSFDTVRSKRIAKDSNATSDVFQNPDGSYSRKVYAGPRNFKAADGSWAPIDTTVARKADGRWHENANAFGVDFAGSGDDATLASVLIDSSRSIGYGLAGAAHVAASVSGSTAAYPGILPGTDLEVMTTTAGVKESLVLHSASAGSSWVFPLRLQGLTPRVGTDGTLSFVDSVGAVRATVPSGSMMDSKRGEPASSSGVSYEVVTFDGAPALRLTVDSLWLSDPARVFPVTVDPSLAIGPSVSTFADTTIGGDNSSSTLLNVGAKDGTEKAYSFLQFPTFGSTYTGATFTGVWLFLFDVWAGSCTAKPFGVSPVTQVWTPSHVTSYPGPSFGASLGTSTPSPGAACTNTGLDPNTGTWMSVGLTPNFFQSWASGGDNYGLAVTADQSDTGAWKRFASATSSVNQPYLYVAYTGNLSPAVDGQAPANNSTVSTLHPTLTVAAHDPDNSGTMSYAFALFDAANTNTTLNTPAWSTSAVLPTPTLVLGKNYLWYGSVKDAVGAVTTSQVYSFRVEAAQPPITSHLSQNSDRGLDPSIGNYTTSATDANVLTAGPALSIQRSYNSKDPRVAGGFGAGWSSVPDARAVERNDTVAGIFSVVVTYPDGQEVAFGRASDGSFLPPMGRYATLATATGGGYTLTDKNQIVYTFSQLLSSGTYGLTSIADPNARAVTFGYASGLLTSMTSSVSGRVLHLTWSTPAGASAPHIASLYTDPAVTGDNSTVQTWGYTYSGDQLTKVCPPTSTTACTTYAYTSASRYPNTVLDRGPRSYWRLAESSGTLANSQVLANNGGDAASYHNVTLGVTGPLPGSSATAASFDGTTSYVDLTQGGVAAKQVFNDSMPMSVSMWFKSTDVDAPLVSYESSPISAGGSALFVPALYIGTSGKLHGEFWGTSMGGPAIVTPTAVNDGAWHHVVLAYGNNLQTMYLDGASVGTLTGTVSAAGMPYQYVGAGYLGGAWPDQGWPSSVFPAYCGCTIADVAFSNTTLDTPSVNAMYAAGHTTGKLLSSITRPSGNAQTGVTYDPGSGRVTTASDANGGTWTMGQPSVAGSSQVFANAVLGGAPQGYWRLNDTSGSTARDQIHGGDGTYSGVTLNVGSPFADGTSAASFNGTSSYLSLPNNIVDGKGSMSLSMWFKSTDTVAPLLSYNDAPRPGQRRELALRGADL